MYDQKTIFQLQINTSIHANIIKDKISLTINIIVTHRKFFSKYKFHIFLTSVFLNFPFFLSAYSDTQKTKKNASIPAASFWFSVFLSTYSGKPENSGKLKLKICKIYIFLKFILVVTIISIIKIISSFEMFACIKVFILSWNIVFWSYKLETNVNQSITKSRCVGINLNYMIFSSLTRLLQ